MVKKENTNLLFKNDSFLFKNDNEVVDPAVDIREEDNMYSWIKIWICSIWGKWKLLYTAPSELSRGG